MKELNERELLLLACLEGELSADEKAKAEAMLAEDAALQHEYRQLQNTVLKPETATVYKNKSGLKRPVAKEKTPLTYIVWPLAIAASFALLIIIYAPKTDFSQGSIASNAGNVIQNNTAILPGQQQQQTARLNDNNSIEAPRQSDVATAPQASKKQVSNTVTTLEKHTTLIVAEILPKPVVVPTVNIPVLAVQPLMAELPPMPQYSVVGEADEADAPKKGWLAKASATINNWIGYLQKPQLSIDKEENETGREYWAITLETDKYEVEGRLYSRR